MLRKSHFTVLAVGAAVAGLSLFSAGNAQANMIQNGDFSANAALFANFPGYFGGANPASAPDWTISGTGQCGVNGASTGGKVGNVFGPKSLNINTGGTVTDFAFMQHAGTYSQSFPVVAGQIYTVRFVAASRNAQAADMAVNVTDSAGKVLGNIGTVTKPVIPSNSAFTTYRFSFVAPSNRVLALNISDVEPGGLMAPDQTLAFSNVSVVKGGHVGKARAVSESSGKASRANQIINGNFSANAALFTIFPGYFGGGNPASATDWTTSGPGGCGINGTGTGGKVGNVFGPTSLNINTGGTVTDFAFMQHAGTYSQSFPVVAEKTYTVSFVAASRNAQAADMAANVTDSAGKVLGNIGTAAAPVIPGSDKFTTYNFSFIAPSNGTLTLNISDVEPGGLTAPDQTLAFSDVSVIDGRVKLSAIVNRTTVMDGQCVVVSATAKAITGVPISSLRVQAFVNGKSWCASEKTLPSGVAHLLLPLPEVGKNVITVRGGAVTSAPVTVMVKRRRFKIITDPKHLIGMEYETWFGPGYASWGHEEAEPVLGHYSSLDPRVLRQQTLWFNQMGINFVELDWTNNLTKPFPDSAGRECIASNNALFHLYAHMRQHPKIVFLMGPEHNYWMNHTTPYTGPWYKKQIDYVYRHYINNPKYRNIYLHYLGKPLLLLYLNGPRFSHPPVIHDSRFTIRYVGAWLQWTKEQRYGVWSWYDQKATPTFYHGKAEALTVASGYPAINPPSPGMNNWLSADAGGKNYGQTYRTQWRVADRYLPHFLFLCQWNEYEPPDEYNVNLSNDMEPTLMTELGSKRPSGWGFFYNNLTRREIKRYHQIIQAKYGTRTVSDKK